MAFAAGSFVYIAASDLIPESHRARGLKGSLALCGGILTAAIAGWVAHFGHA
jgi:ZIP family zinc transporter/zinc and cadmium transporter